MISLEFRCLIPEVYSYSRRCLDATEIQKNHFLKVDTCRYFEEIIPIIHVSLIFIPRYTVQKQQSNIHVGKYTSPMDPMG